MLFLRFVLGIIAAIVAIKLCFFAVGVFAFMAWTLTGLLIVVGFCWLIFQLMNGRVWSKEPLTPEAEPQVWNHSGDVVLFEEKPSLLQITKVDDTTAGIIKLPNGAAIKIVEEADNVLKVKVLSGAHKGNVAWVSKADVTNYQDKTRK